MKPDYEHSEHNEYIEQRRSELIELIEYQKPTACDECGGDLKYKGLGEYECEKCGHSVFDEYGKVRNYIELHPGVNAVELSEKTGVSKKIIKQMLRDERFDLVNKKGILE